MATRHQSSPTKSLLPSCQYPTVAARTLPYPEISPDHDPQSSTGVPSFGALSIGCQPSMLASQIQARIVPERDSISSVISGPQRQRKLTPRAFHNPAFDRIAA